MGSVFSSILGGCISGAVGFVSAYYMSAINSRRVAADRLRAAFAPELAFMRRARTTNSVDRNQLLTDAFHRHEIAIEEYRPFVPLKSVAAYQDAWKKYYEVGGNVRFYDYYFLTDETKDNGPDVFVRRVENILSFAAPTRFNHWNSRLGSGHIVAALGLFATIGAICIGIWFGVVWCQGYSDTPLNCPTQASGDGHPYRNPEFPPRSLA